jgi:hypothetical protein
VVLLGNSPLLEAGLLQVAVMHDAHPGFTVEEHTVEITHPRYSVNRATAAHGQRHKWMNCLHAIPDSKMRWCLHEPLLASSASAKRSQRNISSATAALSRL